MTSDERRRYSRHLALPGIGAAGQRRLKAGRVLVAGVGGLGSPVALYLAAAGVGVIGLLDFDQVDDSNLQRQVVHSSSAVGRLKTASAAERLADLNPLIEVQRHDLTLRGSNSREVVADYGVVVDGTDNYPARYALNDACVELGLPLVHGSLRRTQGQVAVFWADLGPCYRCLYPEAPPLGLWPNCADDGVLGPLAGVVGSIQAAEVIKLLIGSGEPLIGRMAVIDAWSMRVAEVRLRRAAGCACQRDRCKG